MNVWKTQLIDRFFFIIVPKTLETADFKTQIGLGKMFGKLENAQLQFNPEAHARILCVKIPEALVPAGEL